MNTSEQSEDQDTVNAITALVREADRAFERVGGSSRHWVRDCFLPMLNAAGWQLVQRSAGEAGGVVSRPDLEALLREEIAAEDNGPNAEYCWWCGRDVNGKSGPKQSHTAKCWRVRVEVALAASADALGRPTGEKP